MIDWPLTLWAGLIIRYLVHPPKYYVVDILVLLFAVQVNIKEGL